MSKVISFNELRRLKDSLPNGAMQEIADKLSLDVETVRNYFGGQNFKNGGAIGVHLEAGPDGGLVTLDDTTIFDIAVEMLNQK
jgi:DNA-binding protein